MLLISISTFLDPLSSHSHVLRYDLLCMEDHCTTGGTGLLGIAFESGRRPDRSRSCGDDINLAVTRQVNIACTGKIRFKFSVGIARIGGFLNLDPF